MKIALDIKNGSKVLKPTTDNVILFDGEKWYVTTKQDLLNDCYKLVEQANKDLDEMINENAKFKKEIAEKMLVMSTEIKKLLENKEKNVL